MVAVTLVLSVVAVFSDDNLSPGEREDRGNRFVLGAFSMLAILLAYRMWSGTTGGSSPASQP
jgi:hypothetical protein